MASLSPTLTSQMIRRAINPAIWTAMTSDPLGGADHDAVAFVVDAGGGQVGGAEQTRPVDRGDHLTADGRALHVRVEYRQEDADPGPRLVAQPEFGGGAAFSMRQT